MLTYMDTFKTKFQDILGSFHIFNESEKEEILKFWSKALSYIRLGGSPEAVAASLAIPGAELSTAFYTVPPLIVETSNSPLILDNEGLESTVIFPATKVVHIVEQPGQRSEASIRTLAGQSLQSNTGEDRVLLASCQAPGSSPPKRRRRTAKSPKSPKKRTQVSKRKQSNAKSTQRKRKKADTSIGGSAESQWDNLVKNLADGLVLPLETSNESPKKKRGAASKRSKAAKQPRAKKEAKESETQDQPPLLDGFPSDFVPTSLETANTEAAILDNVQGTMTLLPDGRILNEQNSVTPDSMKKTKKRRSRSKKKLSTVAENVNHTDTPLQATPAVTTTAVVTLPDGTLAQILSEAADGGEQHAPVLELDDLSPVDQLESQDLNNIIFSSVKGVTVSDDHQLVDNLSDEEDNTFETADHDYTLTQGGKKPKRQKGRKGYVKKVRQPLTAEELREKSRCDKCGKVLANPSNLAVHMRSHTGAKPYACSMCDKKFSTHPNCLRHERSHRGEKPYKCPVCEKSFVEKKTMMIHHRTHSDDRPYRCLECGKSFTQAGTLASHMHIHTGWKGHLCDLCGRSFRQKTQLRQHKLRHGSVRNHKCQVCSRTFAVKNDLNRHEKTHNKKSHFVCLLCSREFSRLAYLKDHMNTHTGHQPYTCGSCQQGFAQQSTLYKHLAKCQEEEPGSTSDKAGRGRRKKNWRALVKQQQEETEKRINYIVLSDGSCLKVSEMNDGTAHMENVGSNIPRESEADSANVIPIENLADVYSEQIALLVKKAAQSFDGSPIKSEEKVRVKLEFSEEHLTTAMDVGVKTAQITATVTPGDCTETNDIDLDKTE